MIPGLQILASLATRVKQPLGLAGLMVVVLYAFYYSIAVGLVTGLADQSNMNPQVLGFLDRVVNNVIDKLFWLGLFSVVLAIVSYTVVFVVRAKREGSAPVAGGAEPVAAQPDVAQRSPGREPAVLSRYSDVAVREIREVAERLVGGNDPETGRFLRDTENALLSHPTNRPKDLLSAGAWLLSGLLRSPGERKKRETFRRVIRLLLRHLLDPPRDFKMTSTDIRKAFHECGVEPEDISRNHIEEVYERIGADLARGELRRLISMNPRVEEYVQRKLEDISYSRKQWKLESI